MKGGAAVRVNGVNGTAVAGGEDSLELAGVGFFGGGPPGGFVAGDEVAGDIIGGDPGGGMIVFPLDEVLHGRSTGGVGSAADDGVDFAVGLVGIVVVEGGFRRGGWGRVLVVEGEEGEREGGVVVGGEAEAEGRREKRGRGEFRREIEVAGEVVGWERDGLHCYLETLMES